ncbi:D-alanyl-D-alanine carboxypeptidase (penicillin-binding protein 5/6) [Desulfitispora alkaliphila]|uniref:D-alanyl-D-alanine carboxypeptidase family protein n=1 Tax=Desulfitispora alkaliphila TaxID=622674 RepID=UPI003D1F0120
MCKLRVIVTIVGMIFISLFLNTQDCAASEEIVEPKLRASAAILIEADSGEVLFEKNSHKKRSPASLTKMMTAILAIELGDLQSVATVSKNGAGNKVGADISLRAGDQLYLRDLVKAALLVSANDSTVVIAEHVAGSEKRFIQLMNVKAKAIGAHNTSFKNTNGYTAPNHYSTAADLAMIARYGLNNYTFATIAKTDETKIRILNKDRELTLIHSNRLQRSYEWINGIKTGTTASAGKCLAAAGEKDGRQLIAVVLNSSDRYGEALKLLEYGFSLEQGSK